MKYLKTSRIVITSLTQKKNAYWEAIRLAEYKELGFNPDLSRKYVVEHVLKLNSTSQLEPE